MSFDAGTVTAELDLDRTPFTTSLAQARRQAATFARQTYEATVGVRGATETAAEIKGVDKEADSLDGRDIDVDVDKDGSASSSFKSLASNIRATGTVLAATAIPFGIAAIGAAGGAIPAVAASLAGLALNLGQAAAGFTLVGAAAGGGALVGLRAYSALISRVASDTRAAYEATHADAVAQLTDRRNRILNTKAAEAFNEELNRQVINLTNLEAAVGNRVFPVFTREMQAWTPILQEMTPLIARTAGDIAGIAAGFAKWFRTADDGQLLRQVVEFISDSARKAAAFLAAAGQAGLMAFRPLIPLASAFQDQILGIVRETDRWVSSAEGQRRLAGIYRSLWNEARRLGPVLLDLGRGLVNIFDALDRTGIADQASRGLAAIASGFARITRRGTESRQALNRFLNDAQSLMPFVGRAVLSLARALGGIASAAIRARQEGHKLTILQEIFRGIGRAAAPLRRLVVGTFTDLGPEIAKLIPRLSRFFSVFAGSSGPLVAFVRVINRALQIFNNLPGPVKRTVVNLAALKLILGSLGLGAVIGPMGRFASNMLLARGAAAKLAEKSALAAVVSGIAQLGLLLGAGIGLVALAGGLYLVYKRNKLVREAVNNLVDRLKNHLRPEIARAQDAWKTFGKGVAARIDQLGDVIVSVFDLRRKNREAKIKQFGENAAVDFGLGLRSHARRMDTDGGPGFELGTKLGLAIGHGIRNWLIGKGASDKGALGISSAKWVTYLTPAGMETAFNEWIGRVVGPNILKGIGWKAIGQFFKREFIFALTAGGLVPALTDWTKNHIVKPITNAIKNAHWGDLGRDAAWGLITGFTDVNIASKIGKKISGVLDFLKKDNDGNSPWGSTRKLGRDAARGFGLGLLEDGGLIKRNASDMAGRVAKALRDGVVDLGDIPRGAWDKLLKRGWMGRAGDSAERLYAPDNRRWNSRLDPNRGRAGYVQAEDGSWVPRSFYGGDGRDPRRRRSYGLGGALRGGMVNYGAVSERVWRQLMAHGWAGDPSDSAERLYSPRQQFARGHGGSWATRPGSAGGTGITAKEMDQILAKHTRTQARLMIAGMKDAPNLREFQRQQDKVQGGYFHFRNGMNPEPQ